MCWPFGLNCGEKKEIKSCSFVKLYFVVFNQVVCDDREFCIGKEEAQSNCHTRWNWFLIFFANRTYTELRTFCLHCFADEFVHCRNAPEISSILHRAYQGIFFNARLGKMSCVNMTGQLKPSLTQFYYSCIKRPGAQRLFSYKIYIKKETN